MTETAIKNRKSLANKTYHDDLGKDNYLSGSFPHKNHQQILFRPGQPVQNRELNFLQTILHEKLKNGTDLSFKNGQVIAGLHLTITESSTPGEYGLTLSEGLVYWDGTFHIVNETNVGTFTAASFTKFGTTDKLYAMLALKPTYTTIDVYSDDTLGDPAILYQTNQKIRGADRLYFTLEVQNCDLKYDDTTKLMDKSDDYKATYRQSFDIVEIVATTDGGDPELLSDFSVKELNRASSVSLEEKTSDDTKILFGLKVNPLIGAENYLFGGTGDFFGQYAEENSESGGNNFDPYTFKVTDKVNFHPFIVHVTEGAGKVNGYDVVNSFSKAFAFDKSVSTVSSVDVNDLLYMTAITRTFQGVPFQVFVHVQEYTDITDITKSEQTASLLTPDDAIFKNSMYTGLWSDGWKTADYPEPALNYDGRAVAFQVLRPGTKVEICATEFSKSGSTYGADYECAIADARVAQVHPIQYLMIPGGSTAECFCLDPFAMDRWLAGEYDIPTKIQYVVTVFAVFYHRFEMKEITETEESFNFGHLLDPSDFTVAEITDGVTPVEDVTITKFNTKIFVEDQLVDIGLETDSTPSAIPMLEKYRELQYFNILPNVRVMTEAQKKKYFPGYPDTIKTPIDTLHHPYEKEVNSIEIISAIDKPASITGTDVPHIDYFSVDMEGEGLSDSFVEVDSILGYYEVSAQKKIFWMTKNDENYMSRQRTENETYRYGENVIPEYESTDPRKIQALKGLSKNIEAWGIITSKIAFADNTERDNAKVLFEACDGPFMYAHDSSDASSVPSDMRDFNNNPETHKFYNTFPFVARIFDWEDGSRSGELKISYAQISCIDTLDSGGGSVVDFYTHQFNFYLFYLGVQWSNMFFFDGRTDTTNRYHDLLEVSGAALHARLFASQTPVYIDSTVYPQPARGTRYWAVSDDTDSDQKIEPIFPHSPLFRYTMPQYTSGSATDRRSIVHKNDTDVTIQGYGKKLHDGGENLIEHEIVFDSLADRLRINDYNVMRAQMHKTKEAFGTYYENITGENGYHVVSKFNVGFTASSQMLKYMQDGIDNMPFVGFRYDTLSMLLDTAKTEGWHGYVKLNYDIWLPCMIHFFANEDNEIFCEMTEPGTLKILDKITSSGVLYIGSCHIPPKGWHGYPLTQQNLPEKATEFYEKMLVASQSFKNKAENELQTVHAKNIRTGTPTVEFGTDSDGVVLKMSVLQHRYDNPYALDLFLLQPEDQRDNFDSIFGTSFLVDSDIAKPNPTVANHNREDQEISVETFPVYVQAQSGDVWSAGASLTAYEHNGKKFVTLTPLGQKILVDTGDYRNYSTTLSTSYLDTGLYNGFKIKHIFATQDGALTPDTSLWSYQDKFYDTCNNAGFGFYVSPSYFKAQTDYFFSSVRCESENIVPLSRIHFESDTPARYAGRKEHLKQSASIETVDARAHRFVPMLSLGAFSNNALSRQNMRKSQYSTGMNQSTNLDFYSFGYYTVPVETYFECFPNEIKYYGSKSGHLSQLSEVVPSLGLVPLYPANANQQFSAPTDLKMDFVDTEEVAFACIFWCNREWSEIVAPSQSGAVDATADYLQSFLPAGRHLIGFTQTFDSLGGDADTPHCGVFRVLKLGDAWQRDTKELDHIFASTADPHVFMYFEADTRDSAYLLNAVNETSLKENVVVPRASQTYLFEEDRILRSFKIAFANDPWVDNVFESNDYVSGNANEKIAVFFGYTINGKIDPEGFVHTAFIKRTDMDEHFVVDKELELPIYVKRGKEFFVGILHINHDVTSAGVNTPALRVKIIDNGGYSATDKSMMPFPSSAQALIYDGQRFTNRLMKIDLRSFIYSVSASDDGDARSITAANVVSTRPAHLYKPTRVSRFLFLDDPMIPVSTGIDYFWSDGTTPIVNSFVSGKEVTLDEIAADMSFRAILRTEDENISPIFKAGNSPLIVLHETLDYDAGNTHFYAAHTKTDVEAGVLFTDLVSHYDTPARHTIDRPFSRVETLSREFFDNNFSETQEFLGSFWNTVEAKSDLSQTISGSVVEIRLNNLKSNTQFFPVNIPGVTAGHFPFLLVKTFESPITDLTPYFDPELTFPAHLFRLQYDFFDKTYDPKTFSFRDVPFGLYYRHVGYRDFESQVCDLSTALPPSERSWLQAVAYPYNYCYNGLFLESPGVTHETIPLGDGWFRQTIEFVPVGFEFDYNHTVGIVNLLTKANPAFIFTVRPRVIWPLEDYEFMVRIGIENAAAETGKTPVVIKNIKTSFDSLLLKATMANVEAFSQTTKLNSPEGQYGGHDEYEAP